MLARFCRACGGILKEVPDGQSPDELEHVGVPSMPAPSGTDSTELGELQEAEQSREQELARPDWKCPTCGETVPGSFDLCWKCLSADAGEQDSNGAQLASEGGEFDQVPKPGESPVEAEVLEEPDQDAATKAGCLRCGSTKLIRDVSIGNQDGGPDQKLEIVVFGNPEALFFKDRLTGEIRADICGVCGHLEFRVANPGQVYRHYEQAGGLGQPASRQGLFAAPCVRCGMLVVSGTSCPHCGASQAD